MILRELNAPMRTEKFSYIEEQKENVIEVTLKITLDTNYKSVQNYIKKCNEKGKCLASETIKKINDNIKSEYERNL